MLSPTSTIYLLLFSICSHAQYDSKSARVSNNKSAPFTYFRKREYNPISTTWSFTQHKNRNKKPVTLELPIVPELQKIIDASPTGDLTFLVTDFGRPFSAAGFGNRFRKWCNEAGLKNCSAHGLRKAAAARLAELGATEHEIMAVTGHRTSKEVTRYTRAARQRVLAERAMAKMAGGQKANRSVPLKRK